MVKSNKLMTAILSLILLTSPALAESDFDSDNIRLGVGVGLSDAHTSISTLGKFNETLPAYMLNVGYAITPEMELGLMFFNSTQSTVSNGANSITMKVPASTKAYLRKRWFGQDKLGAYGLMAIGPVAHTLRDSAGTTTYSDNFIGLGLGAGVSWHVDPQYMVDAGVMIPNIPLFNKGIGMNTFSPSIMVSLNYAFGAFNEAPHRTPSPITTNHVQEPAPQPVSKTEIVAAPKEQLWTTIPFDSGYTDLNAESHRVLKRSIKNTLLNKQQYSIEIRGYADAEPIGGYSSKRHTPIHNFRSQKTLSAARAESVAKALVKAGIDRNIIHTEGFGATNFIANNNSKANRSKNRRVEIYLITTN